MIDKYKNYTTKCNKCLHCANYMYVCRGEENFNEVEKCKEYEYDMNAYIRQDMDETYMPDIEHMNEDINNSLKYHNEYKTKTYIYDSNDNIISVCYTTSIPQVNETIIIHTEGIFNNYKVTKRILGINNDIGVTVWNLYVIKL